MRANATTPHSSAGLQPDCADVPISVQFFRRNSNMPRTPWLTRSAISSIAASFRLALRGSTSARKTCFFVGQQNDGDVLRDFVVAHGTRSYRGRHPRPIPADIIRLAV